MGAQGRAEKAIGCGSRARASGGERTDHSTVSENDDPTQP